MPSTSEVEKLERRYQDNPQGLTFAPLAEYYRKAGDVQRALELTRQGLEVHPDYVPASIVLGRCHLDLAELGEAEAAFSHVLSLDPENVIALKALADIAERDGRSGEAERWLNLLLSVDRSNEDAREQLARLQAAPSPAAAPETAAPAPAVAAEVPVVPLPMPEPEPAAPRTFAAAMEQAIASDTDEYAVPPVVGAPSLSEAEPLEPLALERSADEPELEAPLEPAAELVREPAAEADRVALAEDVEESVAWVSGAGDAASAEAMPLVLDDLTPAEPVARDESLIAEEPEELSAEVQPLEGLVGSQDPREQAGATSILPPEEAGPLVAEQADEGFELAVEREEEIVLEGSAESPYQTHDAASDLGAGLELDVPADDPFAAAVPAIEREEELAAEAAPADADATIEAEREAEAGIAEPAREEQVEDAPIQVDEPARHEEPLAAVEPLEAESHAASVEPEPEEESGALAEGELPEGPVVVTESMAALYLQQGHRAEALDVYRQLLAQRPGDPQLEKRVAGLEAELASEAQAADVADAADAAPVYASALTGGQSVGDFLREVLGQPARIVAPPAPEPQAQAQAQAQATESPAAPAPTAAPTRPAHDALSLSAVFGEETSAAPPAPASENAGAGLSFDEFFGAGQSMPADATRTARPARPQAEDDDLDQFQNWLQNLKR